MDQKSHLIKSKRILIIEDDLSLAKLYCTYIINIDFEVDVLYTGNDAVKQVKEGSYDLIFLDIQMPGKSGFDVLSELKKDPDTSRIPVIMLTNIGEMNSIQKALDMGASDYAIKLNMSADKIKKLVDKHFISNDARTHDIFKG